MLLDVSLEAPQRVAPECVVVPEPVVHGPQRPGVQTAQSGGAVLASHNQACRAQQPEVLGDGGAAGRKVRRDLTDRLLPSTQQAEDLAAGRIGDGAKDDVALSAVNGNHTVTYIVTVWLPSITRLEAPLPADHQN